MCLYFHFFIFDSFLRTVAFEQKLVFNGLSDKNFFSIPNELKSNLNTLILYRSW